MEAQRLKSLPIALCLAVFGGFLGLHRFYLLDRDGGKEFLFSFGLFGVGWVWDVIHIRSLVERCNTKISRLGCQRLVEANDAACSASHCDNAIINTKFGENLLEIIVMFVPKNLYEQFSRHMNRYFLLIALLQLNPNLTPTNPWTTFGPLIVIFTISAIREGLDDYARFASDKTANEREFLVSVNGTLKKTYSRDIRVGNVLQLQGDEEIPCDVVVLASSELDGSCSIQTTNLDGESDMKPRTALPETQRLSKTDLLNFRGSVECAQPNKEIYRFNSVLRHPMYEEAKSISSDQALLQGTHLRNVEWVIAVVVYTGGETKLAMSKNRPRAKWTHTDQLINRITILVFAFQMLLVCGLGSAGNVILDRVATQTWYLGFTSISWFESYLVIPLRYLLLNSTMIPISIKVTIDLCKIIYAKFTAWDLNLCTGDVGVVPRNTGISEDLGQVKYILTDKTGTLTCNEMVLNACSIGGMMYGQGSTLVQDPTLVASLSRADAATVMFFRCLAICNSMQPVIHESMLTYRGSSPDEVALLNTAASLGITLAERHKDSLIIKVGPSAERYTRLVELEFNSDRKRMSVIVREEATNKIFIFTKGADDMIFRRLGSSQPLLTKTTQHVEALSAAGLRTLVVAFRQLSETEFQEWHAQHWVPASNAIQERELRRNEAGEEIERDLELLGATAIQDRLQDAVPDTVKALKTAGVKIWMLTGDKLSTAVQIGRQCRLVSDDISDAPTSFSPGGSVTSQLSSFSTLEIDINDPTECEGAVQRLLETFPIGSRAMSEGNLPVVVCTGRSLGCMSDSAKKIVIDCCTRASAVIMCRLTPLQKAELVKLVKEHTPLSLSRRGGFKDRFNGWFLNEAPVTLAIGDGGNDVPMIQEADIGVGISGHEGLQASRAADYTMGEFRHLKRLLLVHGRYSYERSAFVAQFSFFKSWWFCWIQIFYAFTSEFSGVSLFDPFSIIACNALIFVPITFYSLHRDIDIDLALKNPILYAQGPGSRLMNLASVSSWWFRSIVQAALCFVLLGLGFAANTDSEGHPFDYRELGVSIFVIFVAVQTLTLALETRSFTLLQCVAISCLFIVSIISVSFLNSLLMFSSLVDYFSFFHLFVSPIPLLIFTLALAVSLLPFFALRAVVGRDIRTERNSMQRLSTISSARKDSRAELLQNEQLASELESV